MRTFFDMASSFGWLRCLVRTIVSEKFLYRYHRADLKMRDDLVHNDSFVVFRLSMSFRGSGIDVLLVKNEFTRIVFRLIDRVGNIAFLSIKQHPRGLTEAYKENSCQTPAPRHTLPACAGRYDDEGVIYLRQRVVNVMQSGGRVVSHKRE